MTVLRSLVRMVVSVWMVSINTPVNARPVGGDNIALNVSRGSVGFLMTLMRLLVIGSIYVLNSLISRTVIGSQYVLNSVPYRVLDVIDIARSYWFSTTTRFPIDNSLHFRHFSVLRATCNNCFR